MPVAFRAELCVERRRKAVVEECVSLPACGGNPTIQKIYRLRRRREKRKRFPRFTGFPRSGETPKKDYRSRREVKNSAPVRIFFVSLQVDIRCTIIHIILINNRLT